VSPDTGARQRLRVRALAAAWGIRARLRPPPPLAESEERLLAAARAAAGGLDDFGDPAFLDGLRVLLRAYGEEARLTPFGRFMVEQLLVGALAARLAVRAALARDPALAAAPIRRPLFVLGLPRTGTTALHALLAQDPANQVLEYWLGTAPGPRPPRETWARDPRFRAAAAGLRFTYFLDPALRAIHDLEPDGPDECRHLLLQCFTDDTFDSNATIPSYTAWYARRDMRASYAWHRDALRVIGSTSPGRRWALKYPAHLAHLHVLLETYPDACIVQTHRDPARVLPSLCSLVTGWRAIHEGEVDRRGVARWQVELWAERIEHAMRVRARQDPARFCDLAFREVSGDPLAAVRRIYDRFGFELSPEAEARMRAWVAAHPRERHGAHLYAAAEFGLAPGEVSERFRAYRERFDVGAE
jgi:hypothetical protein